MSSTPRSSRDCLEAERAERKERLMGPPVVVPHPYNEPDAGSAEWEERHKHDRYKHNRLRFGCSLHDILPSRGPDACVYAARCEVIEDPDDRCLCHPGWPCPREAAYFKAVVRSSRYEFRRARGWLSEDDFESTIRDLVLFDLRKMRCIARCNDEGFLRTVRRELPDGCWEMVQVPCLNDRYATAAHRGYDKALRLLAIDPNPTEPEAPVPAWKRDMDAIDRFRRAQPFTAPAKT